MDTDSPRLVGFEIDRRLVRAIVLSPDGTDILAYADSSVMEPGTHDDAFPNPGPAISSIWHKLQLAQYKKLRVAASFGFRHAGVGSSDSMTEWVDVMAAQLDEAIAIVPHSHGGICYAPQTHLEIVREGFQWVGCELDAIELPPISVARTLAFRPSGVLRIGSGVAWQVRIHDGVVLEALPYSGGVTRSGVYTEFFGEQEQSLSVIQRVDVPAGLLASQKLTVGTLAVAVGAALGLVDSDSAGNFCPQLDKIELDADTGHGLTANSAATDLGEPTVTDIDTDPDAAEPQGSTLGSSAAISGLGLAAAAGLARSESPMSTEEDPELDRQPNEIVSPSETLDPDTTATVESEAAAADDDESELADGELGEVESELAEFELADGELGEVEPESVESELADGELGEVGSESVESELDEFELPDGELDEVGSESVESELDEFELADGELDEVGSESVESELDETELPDGELDEVGSESVESELDETELPDGELDEVESELADGELGEVGSESVESELADGESDDEVESGDEVEADDEVESGDDAASGAEEAETSGSTGPPMPDEHFANFDASKTATMAAIPPPMPPQEFQPDEQFASNGNGTHSGSEELDGGEPKQNRQVPLAAWSSDEFHGKTETAHEIVDPESEPSVPSPDPTETQPVPPLEGILINRADEATSSDISSKEWQPFGPPKVPYQQPPAPGSTADLVQPRYANQEIDPTIDGVDSAESTDVLHSAISGAENNGIEGNATAGNGIEGDISDQSIRDAVTIEPSVELFAKMPSVPVESMASTAPVEPVPFADVEPEADDNHSNSETPGLEANAGLLSKPPLNHQVSELTVTGAVPVEKAAAHLEAQLDAEEAELAPLAASEVRSIQQPGPRRAAKRSRKLWPILLPVVVLLVAVAAVVYVWQFVI